MNDPRVKAFQGIIEAFRDAGLENPFNDPGNVSVYSSLYMAPRYSLLNSTDSRVTDVVSISRNSLEFDSGKRPYLSDLTISEFGFAATLAARHISMSFSITAVICGRRPSKMLGIDARADTTNVSSMKCRLRRLPMHGHAHRPVGNPLLPLDDETPVTPFNFSERPDQAFVTVKEERLFVKLPRTSMTRCGVQKNRGGFFAWPRHGCSPHISRSHPITDWPLLGNVARAQWRAS